MKHKLKLKISNILSQWLNNLLEVDSYFFGEKKMKLTFRIFFIFKKNCK